MQSFVFTKEERAAISEQIKDLVQQEAVSEVESSKGFVSNVFLVPKSGNRWRLILNLKSLNTYTEYAHFKMEDIH